jgi:hypothetical protein
LVPFRSLHHLQEPPFAFRSLHSCSGASNRLQEPISAFRSPHPCSGAATMFRIPQPCSRAPTQVQELPPKGAPPSCQREELSNFFK